MQLEEWKEERGRRGGCNQLEGRSRRMRRRRGRCGCKEEGER